MRSALAFAPVRRRMGAASAAEAFLYHRTGQHEKHRGADDGHAGEYGRIGRFVKHEYAHGHGGERFHHAQNGSQGGAYAPYGQYQRKVGDGGGDDGKQHGKARLIPGMESHEGTGEHGVQKRDDHAEEEHPEGDAQAGNAADAGDVQAADVHGVAQGGNKQQQNAFQTDASAFSPAEQKDSQNGQRHG